MKARVLIVDDEEVILQSWENVLASAGYDVETALSGHEAVEIVHKQKPHIVITDLIMPDMNGIELCKRIKEMNPKTEVVLLSGHPDTVDKYQKDFVSAGGRDGILMKPLFISEIIKAVATIMNEKV